jgi:hypothetical protein
MKFSANFETSQQMSFRGKSSLQAANLNEKFDQSTLL